MTNYKLYFKLLKKHIPQAMIYLFFFIGILLVQVYNIDVEPNDLDRVYIVGNQESRLCQGIKGYLEENEPVKVIFFEYKKEETSTQEGEKRLHKLIDEAILTDAANCVLRIYEEDLEKEENQICHKKIEVFAKSETALLLEIQQCVEAYIYKQEDEKQHKEFRTVKEQGNKKVEAIDEYSTYRLNRVRKYLNFLIYGLSTIICTGIISVSSSINCIQIKERRCYAPIEADMEKDLLKCHFLFGFMLLGILLLPSFYFDRQLMFSVKGILLALNAILVTGNLIMIGYLVSLFVSSLNMEMIVVNVISLGTLFVSGILEEQWKLSELAIRIGAFFPTYWYVRSNNLITISEINTISGYKSLLNALFIQILFLIALFAIALIIKMQSLEEEEK